MPKLFINSSHFVDLNFDGTPTETPMEGTLGIILKAWNADKTTKLALKLPRLAADSASENAYVVKLLEAELKGASLYLSREAAAGNLVTFEGGYSNSFTRRLPSDGPIAQEHPEQMGMLVITVYQKGLPVRLFGVRKDEKTGEWSSVPTAPPEVLRTLDPYWDRLIQGPGATPCIFDVDLNAPSTPPVLPSLDYHFRVASNKLWCVTRCPSVAYAWYEMTLSELVAKDPGYLKKWRLRDHIRMRQELLETVHSNFHSRRIVHADLRPANIFLTQTHHPRPRAYGFAIGDFGSFSQQDMPAATPIPTKGSTVVGVTTGKNRSSPFYSVDRRRGNEYEHATSAFIVPCLNPKAGYYILLSPGRPAGELNAISQLITTAGEPLNRSARSKLTEAITSLSKLKSERELQGKLELEEEVEGIQKRIKQLEEHLALLVGDGTEPHNTSSTGAFVFGDHIQIGDLVFRLMASSRLEGTNRQTSGGRIKLPDHSWLLLCEPRYGRVLHDRFTVIEDTCITAPMLVPIGRFTHIRSWNSSVDMYSIGVIALYALFVAGTDESQLYCVEDDFADMIEIMEKEGYFLGMWLEIAEWVEEAMKLANDQKTGKELTDAASPDKLEHEPQSGTMIKHARRSASYLTKSVPHIKRVARALDGNVAEFVFAVYFALGAIHREDEILSDKTKAAIADIRPEKQGFNRVPFNKPRHADDFMAANRALSYLREIEPFVSFFAERDAAATKGFFADFKMKLDDDHKPAKGNE